MMKLSPVEIKTQEFAKTFRGYAPDEVRSFLDAVVETMEEMIEHQRELDQKIVVLETQLSDYKTIEKSLQQTLMQAQESSAKSVENARQEGYLILREAELKASQMLDKARNDLSSLKEHVTILKAKKDSVVSRLRMLLNSELELIKALEVDEELQPKSTEEQQELSKERMEIEAIIKSLDQPTTADKSPDAQ